MHTTYANLTATRASFPARFAIGNVAKQHVNAYKSYTVGCVAVVWVPAVPDHSYSHHLSVPMLWSPVMFVALALGYLTMDVKNMSKGKI